MDENFQVVELGEKSVEKIAKEIYKIQKKEKEKNKDREYQNTKLLLIKYQYLKKHCEIVDEQVTEELGSVWSDWRFDLNILLEHKAKTAKLMKHVDKALLFYEVINESGYRLIKRKFLDENVNNDDMCIAIDYGVDRRTVGRRIEKCIEDLSILIFGIDVILKTPI